MKYPSPDGAPRGETTCGALAMLADEWLRVVADAGFVPGPRARARARLLEMLHRLIAAARAEAFDAADGHRAGVELVEHRMFAPPVIGATVQLLGHRLPPLIGRADAADRVLHLLGALATGFAEAQRDVAVAAAESMNASQKVLWLGEHADLRGRLRHALLRDPVTHLPNLGFLRGHLQELIATPGAAYRIGVCLLAVDGFSDLSHALGHDSGGRLLTVVARRWTRAAGQTGAFLAHLGGPRFVLVAGGTTGPDDVVKAVDGMRRALQAPVDIDGHQLHVGAKAGIAEGPARGTDPLNWLRDADIALDWAHTDPHHPIAVFDAGRAAVDHRRHRLATAMPAAIERHEFTVHYQPIHRLTDRTIIGFEALARWQRPDGALLGPRDFIALAEQTGLITPLGLHVLEQACTQAAAWRWQGHYLLASVNLSPVQLGDPGLIEAVTGILARTGLPPRSLQLEITESAAVDTHHEPLRRLAELGIHLAIDDFGTGYSSLTALPRLPVSTVKLAAEFLPLAADTAEGPVLLRDTVTLLHNLGISVTAEGIETTDQEQRVRDLGCDNGQGFHLARPDTAQAFTELLYRRTR
jgi:diguanylate cyclase (GGDEF)-like protein